MRCCLRQAVAAGGAAAAAVMVCVVLTAGSRVPGPVLLQARAQDGHTGISTDAIDGDGLIDKGWKQMWKAIPAGYRAVSKELKGYMVDGHAEDKTEKKASSELSDYANILKGEDAWPVRTPEAQAAAEEGKTYDKELASYDDILSFPPAHRKIPVVPAGTEETVKARIRKAEAQLKRVDAKLHAMRGAASAHSLPQPDADADVPAHDDKRCQECKQRWTRSSLECAEATCERKMWRTPLEKEQVQLNDKLASLLQACLPQGRGEVVVSSFEYPWTQPFRQPAHSWVRAVAVGEGDDGLGLVDGETAKLKLAGRQMLSGADLKCRDGRSLDDHVSDLVAPQKELNQKNARAYFASLSKTREGARRMADKALENQLAGAAVLSWISPPPPEANQSVQRRAPKHAQGQGEKSQAPGGVGQEELKLKREIEALKVARLRKRLLRQQRREAQGGSYPGQTTRGGYYGDGWRRSTGSRERQRGRGRQGRREGEKLAVDEEAARREEDRKEERLMRRHTEHIAERREIRAAIHKRQQRMRRENSLVDKDLAEVAEGASMEKALTKALAAKEALLRAIKDKSDEIHARAMHARTTESQSQQQLRRTTQKRLTDQMRSDEMSLRKLQDSQQSGVLEQTRAVRRRARRAEALTLSRLRHKRLSLQHKLLQETISRLKSKLGARGVAASLAT